jgi:Fur family ferric uptake transcriptional regulator
VRVTAQRLAVYRAVAGDLGHPTAAAVHEALRGEIPSLPLASVYRILESLEREGMLRRVGSLGGGGRYDANVGPHQHLVCRRCGGMTDFLDPSFADLAARPGDPGLSARERRRPDPRHLRSLRAAPSHFPAGVEAPERHPARRPAVGG